MSTYLAIGSVCWDEVPVEGGVDRRLGGSVLFASRVALEAGWDVHVVTSGTDDLAAAARAALPGVRVTVQPSAHDTVMRFGLESDLGPQAVPTVADPIDLARVGVDPAGADVVHLAPILGEVTADLVRSVDGDGLVGITPQGLLRTLDPVTARLGLIDHPGASWAEGVDVVVVSESEHAQIAEPLAVGGRAVAVTRGDRGCFGERDGEVIDLPGVPVVEAPAGTIGAGDVFASALLVALASGAPFSEAMDRSNRRAAAHVAGRP